MAAFPKHSRAVGFKASSHRFRSAVRLLVWVALPAFAHGEGFLCDNYNCSDYTQTTMILAGDEVAEGDPQQFLISGTLPDDIALFSVLTDMRLLYNRFSGTISKAITDLPLETLDLFTNYFSGTIPADLSKLTALQRLDLARNALSGTIPEGLTDLALLRILFLKDNEISGTVPRQIGKLSRLGILEFTSMALTGPIPESFGGLDPEICALQEGNPELSCYEGEISDFRESTSCLREAAQIPCQPPSAPPPPLSPPPLEAVVQFTVSCEGVGVTNRRKLQDGEPLSTDSVFAYVSTTMPEDVADRDIVVTAVRNGRGRRLQQGEPEGRRLQDDDPCDFDYPVEVYVRGDVTIDEVLVVVNAPSFEAGLDDFIVEPVGIGEVTTAVVLVPSPFAPPSSPPLQEVVFVDIAEIDSNGRRRMQDGVPLSEESVFAYVSTTMPDGVADRDIIVSAVRGGRGRRLQEDELNGRQLQDPDDLVYLVDIYVRGDVTSDEILNVVSSTAWEAGLDAFIAEPVGVLSVALGLQPTPAPFSPPSAPAPATRTEYVCFDVHCRLCGAAADGCAMGSACYVHRCGQGLGSSTKTECEQTCKAPPARARKDPHLYLPHGARADFRGAHNATFAMLSAKDVAFNVKVLGEDFNWAKRIVHGTKMAAAYWVVRTSTGRLIKVEYDCTSTLGGVVRETGQRDIYLKKVESPLTVDNVFIAMMESKKLVVTVDGKWTLSASVSPIPFGNLAANKNKKLLDIEIEPLYDADSDVVAPHGIIGQAYDGDDIGIHGKLDSRHGNETTTTAQAEGAIEGLWEEYIVPSPFSTEFKYSRFDATAAKPRDVSALTGVKTAWRSVKKQTISAAKTFEVALATQ
uniref:Uncharacterized protein n=1 Tax=Chrysotila carterae TaxID=13221 RepID=A0A7S4F9R6_CHRCT